MVNDVEQLSDIAEAATAVIGVGLAALGFERWEGAAP